MLLMVATMALAACTVKKGTITQKNAAAQTDTFKTKSGKEVIFTAIKHASIRITYEGKEIEVDPVRALKPTTDYSRFPKADYILVTHEHFDHCDTAAIRQLEKPTTVIVTNANCAKIIDKSKAMYNGDHMKLADDITIDAVPAYNTTPGKEKYHPKGLKNIDVAFLSTNQPFTMTPEQTARAAKTIKPKVLYPYHYSDTDIQKVAALLKGTGIKVLIRNYQ